MKRIVIFGGLILGVCLFCRPATAELRAGAAAVDVTPEHLPTVINGSFTAHNATVIGSRLFARALALDDGNTRVALVVVDSCMLPRDLIDEAKKLASQRTGLPADRMLISATHTHSAPSAMGALGTDPDPVYPAFLVKRLVDVIVQATGRLEPARVGFAVADATPLVGVRRWVLRPDKIQLDPFGNPTVRANMHVASVPANATGPTGPVDPDLSIIALQSKTGRPIALLANLGMHYHGVDGTNGQYPVSADYFGLFAQRLQAQIAPRDPDGTKPPFVAIMSQGTSGDVWHRDYERPLPQVGGDLSRFTDAAVALALGANKQAHFRDNATLTMAQTELPLRYRTPTAERLAWAQNTIQALGSRPLKEPRDIYAREAILLHQKQQTRIVLQALRVDDIAITGIPNEVYALTGLKLKAQSPLPHTMNISLANGAEGYIPPTEQFALGGYNTWPARTAGLEQTAEPRITEAVLRLLETVAGRPRRSITSTRGPAAGAVLSTKPVAYFRMDESSGSRAVDLVGGHDGLFESGVLFYLEGPRSSTFNRPGEINRAAHFAGGRMTTRIPGLADSHTVSMWFWNGMTTDARTITGTLLSRGQPLGAGTDVLAIGGKDAHEGRLIYGDKAVAGETRIERYAWNHVVQVRSGKRVRIYLNGALRPEIDTEATGTTPGADTLFIGGPPDGTNSFEGRIDEVAVWNRAVTPAEIVKMFKAAGPGPGPAPAPRSDLLTPEQSLRAFKIEPGLAVELVAAEPEIESPVAAAFDADGRLWVAEMRDYPVVVAGQPPKGRLKILEDRDGDGRFETARVFADGILWINGVLPWRKGAIVTAGTQIIYVSDEDGDGRADKKSVLYEGFDVTNPQLLVSHPTLGLDNWIYVANGMRSTKVSRPGGGPGGAINIQGMDFRFDPLGDRAEAAAGMGQFGLTFDAWGNRFVCTNRSHIIPLPLQARYLGRNPYFAASTLSPTPVQAAKVFSISDNKTNAASHAGTFTAASGTFVYEGSLLPAKHRGTIFSAEPTGNLVHQEILTPSGSGFTHAAARANVEFLASPDPRFRPVSFFPGPDGALYVVDMYRSEIEHPDWVPPELRSRYNFEGRRDLGRIWRVVPAGTRPSRPKPRLNAATTRALVGHLGNDDIWWRRTAQRLLLQRQDSLAIPLLRRLVLTSPKPFARVHAAWLLEGRNALTPDLVRNLLGDKHPRVRELGVRLGEQWIQNKTDVRVAIESLAADPDVGVRRQVALSMGDIDNDTIVAPLGAIAAAAPHDPWTQVAIATAAKGRAAALVRYVRDGVFLAELGAMIGARNDPDEIARAVRESANDPKARRIALMASIAAGMQRRGSKGPGLLAALPQGPTRLAVEAILRDADSTARDPKQPNSERVSAVQLLGHAPWPRGADTLGYLLAHDLDPQVRVAALNAMAGHQRAEAFAALIALWDVYQPVERRDLQIALAKSNLGLEALMNAVEAKRIPARSLDTAVVQRLTSHSDKAIAARARRILESALPADRAAVLVQYRPALQGKGDPAKGRETFSRICAACHRVGDVGTTVGPDISDVDRKPAEAVMKDVLDPNGAIDANYVNFVVMLKNGESATGFIAQQTAASLTLRRGANDDQIVLREDIKEIVPSGVSLMPEGLENAIPIPDMRDLLAFLRGWRDLPRQQ